MQRQETHLGHRPGRAAHLAAVLALAAIAIALTASVAQGAIPRSFWGIGSQTALDDASLDRMGQGQVGTLRQAIFWSITDPSPAAGDENWSSVDPIVAGAARNGVEILPFFFGTPAWVAQGLDGRNCKPEKCGTFAPKKKAALEAWKTYLGLVVDRYGPNGTFWTDHPTIPKLPFRAYQIWNEMNSSTFFKPKPKPKDYAKMLNASAEAIRPKDPAAQIVLGGMAELAGSKEAVDASGYLKDLYKIAGVEDDFDGVAIHPYGASVQKISSQVELFRKVMKQAGDSGASMWVTEIGAGSKDGGNPLNRGKQGQAQLLTKAFNLFKRSRNKHNIENVTWFSWMDSTESICAWCKTSGLFKQGLKPKPAWNAFTKFTGGS